MPSGNAVTRTNIFACAWRWSVNTLVITLIAILGYASYLHVTGNVHVVIPNEVIRSASLSESQLQNLIATHHVKSIINLAPQEANAPTELEISTRSHINYFPLSMYAHGLPPIAILKQLTALITMTPRPVLIHCRQGADRTGLAAAIALILTTRATPAMIQKQYSLRYGAISPTSIGKQVMHYYFLWLQKNNFSSTPQNFLIWLQQLKVGSDYPYNPTLYKN